MYSYSSFVERTKTFSNTCYFAKIKIQNNLISTKTRITVRNSESKTATLTVESLSITMVNFVKNSEDFINIFL